MLSIREILQRLGLSLRKGGGRRFYLPIIALLCAAALGSWFMMRPSEAEWTADALYYVKPNGSGDGNGSSWANAMSGTAFSTKLKEINAANDGKAYEFRVAKGIYEQSETLRLPKGVKLYGGFAGTETTAEEIEARDIAKNVTTLSRDAAAASDANFSIVTVGMNATSADTRFDGFTVTGGKNDNGGGMYITYGAPTIANCTFSGNSADSRGDRALGGGMYIIGGSPIIENCIFAGNSAQGYSNAHGGGMYIVEGSPVIENCTFTDNSASHPGTNACGGGMYVRNGSPIVKNSTFSGNSSKYDTARGVGMYLAGSGTTAVVNCTFSGNNAPGGANGGGMCVSDSAGAAVTNCTFSGNSAGTGGGISVQSDANVAAANSVFYGNTASVSGKEISVSTATLTLQNCIAAEGGVTNDKGTITSTDLYTGNPKFLTASPDNNGGTVPT
ncbi:MAG: right-handed parallel beta-helix repeat-containing protein, partial [Christensenella sp.]